MEKSTFFLIFKCVLTLPIYRLPIFDGLVHIHNTQKYFFLSKHHEWLLTFCYQPPWGTFWLWWKEISFNIKCSLQLDWWNCNSDLFIKMHPFFRNYILIQKLKSNIFDQLFMFSFKRTQIANWFKLIKWNF